MANTTRRDFLKFSVVGAAAASLGLAGCDDDAQTTTTLNDANDSLTGSFTHGVASGDPLSDRVILWTRFVPENDALDSVTLDYEVATDDSFSAPVSSGTLAASQDADWTAKVDATGLAPDTSYFYRFKVGDQQVSELGTTRTLPVGPVDQVRFAVFSCSNFPAGYFHPYRQALDEGELDAVLHLGDYIYEYAADGYASAEAEALGRVSQPSNELLSLTDYRTRYAQYRSDPDLKALHAKLPWIIVWDDHEIANDGHTTGAENHSDDEGNYQARREAAAKAYHEWLPIRTPNADNLLEIYRGFEFGDLLSLHMLDTRHIGRDQQVAQTDPNFVALISDPNRQLLGDAQQQWLSGRLATSQATWQVLGQQVLMGRMVIPASILLSAFDAEGNPAPAAFNAALTDYLTAAQTAQLAPEALTPTQQALLDPTLNPALPYNLDAWDGYQASREQVLMAASGKNLVCLSGDTHNAWGNNLTLADGTPAGVEFATTSVSSPGFEGVFGFDVDTAAQFSAALTQLIPDLQYSDSYHRGLLLMTFTPEATTGEWVFVDGVKDTEFNVPAELRKSLQVVAGSNVMSEI